MERFEFDYSKITLEEIESYEHFDFICDGDTQKVIGVVKDDIQ